MYVLFLPFGIRELKEDASKPWNYRLSLFNQRAKSFDLVPYIQQHHYSEIQTKK